jgi:hypothetical protein
MAMLKGQLPAFYRPLPGFENVPALASFEG